MKAIVFCLKPSTQLYSFPGGERPLKVSVSPSSLLSAHLLSLPLPKKPELDNTYLNNDRPISKLPFLSTILEKFAFQQLQSFSS